MKALTNINFEQEISKGISVIEFWSEKCSTCVLLAPHLEKIAEKYSGKIKFFIVDTDEQKYLSWIQNILSMPTIKIFKDRKEMGKIVNNDLEFLKEILNNLLSEEE